MGAITFNGMAVATDAVSQTKYIAGWSARRSTLIRVLRRLKQQCFELRERIFDWIQVRTEGRENSQVCQSP
jgi:hypothetical protein